MSCSPPAASVVVVGAAGVGKSTFVAALKKYCSARHSFANHFAFAPSDIYEIQDLRASRAFLKSLSSFLLIFMITLEGGRLQAQDADLFRLFAKRRDCLVIVNKVKDLSRETCSHISSYFHYPVTVRSILYREDFLENYMDGTVLGMQHIFFNHLTPRPFENFLFPDEEKELLRQENLEQEVRQKRELEKEQRQKQRLYHQQQVARRQLIASLRELEKHENWKGFTIPVETVSERMTKFPSESLETATMWSNHSKQAALSHREAMLCCKYSLVCPTNPCYANSNFSFREFQGKKYLVAVNGDTST